MASSRPTSQYKTFRRIFSDVLLDQIEEPSTSEKKKLPRHTRHFHARQRQREDRYIRGIGLEEFIEYITSETFDSFPEDLKSLTYAGWASSKDLRDRYALPLTASNVATILPNLEETIGESLAAYDIVNEGVFEFLAPVLSEYVTAVTTRQDRLD